MTSGDLGFADPDGFGALQYIRTITLNWFEHPTLGGAH
jgi:hypothetical protein